MVVDELELADVAYALGQHMLTINAELRLNVLRLGPDRRTPGHAATESVCACRSSGSAGFPKLSKKLRAQERRSPFSGDLKKGPGGCLHEEGRVRAVILRWWKQGGRQERTLTVLLHDGEHLDNHLGAGADQHLALSAALGVDNVVEAVVKDGDADHCGRLATTCQFVSRGT